MTTPIPLRDALKASLDHPDEIELAGMLMDHATALRACGERIRQSTLRGDSQHERDQRTFILADALAIARDAEQGQCKFQDAGEVVEAANEPREAPEHVEARHQRLAVRHLEQHLELRTVEIERAS